MNWNSPGEFFAMGGYAFYVWGSFVACALAFACEIGLVRQRRRAILRSLQRERRADAMEKEGNSA